MRWVLTLVAFSLGVWYLTNRRRRDQLQEKVWDATPQEVQTRAWNMATTASDAAQEFAQKASKAAGDAVETDVNTPPPSIHETVQAEMADVDEQVDGLRAQSEAPPDPAEKSAGEVFGAGTTATTAMRATQAPATAEEAETVKGGVEPLDAGQMSQSGAMAASTTRKGKGGIGGRSTPPDSASTGAEGVQGVVGRTLTTDDSIVPEGERPRPIAGEGTTTASGGTVDTLSPDPDGATATGKPEPLPQGLTAGAPGTGGPAASTIAPSTPDSVETPTTGMETAPVVDRAAEVAERTGGKIVGNKKTRVFHPATADDLPGESNRVYFDSVEEATGAGFTPTPDVDFRDL